MNSAASSTSKGTNAIETALIDLYSHEDCLRICHECKNFYKQRDIGYEWRSTDYVKGLQTHLILESPKFSWLYRRMQANVFYRISYGGTERNYEKETSTQFRHKFYWLVHGHPTIIYDIRLCWCCVNDADSDYDMYLTSKDYSLAHPELCDESDEERQAEEEEQDIDDEQRPKTQ